MTWAGCYSLDLYCDNSKNGGDDGIHRWDEFPHQYNDEFGATCRAIARKDGWVIRKDGTCICPKCSGNLNKHQPAGEKPQHKPKR